MSFTKIKTTQNVFLEKYLRGTGKSLSADQARALFGIKNFYANILEFKNAGAKVRAKPNTAGKLAYQISARDVLGSRAKIFK